jgi:hypothetical protein
MECANNGSTPTDNTTSDSSPSGNNIPNSAKMDVDSLSDSGETSDALASDAEANIR